MGAGAAEEEDEAAAAGAAAARCLAASLSHEADNRFTRGGDGVVGRAKSI